eukprot:6534571-Alexandrium_andersonii.AAC.1
MRTPECKGSIRRRGGGACLGLLGQKGSEAGGEGLAMWRVRHTPQWRAEDLVSWLTDFGWSNIVVLSPPRGRLGWLVRGRPHMGGE